MNSLANETDVIWLEDPTLYPYIRVYWIPATRRRQRPPQSHLGDLRLIGYTAVAQCRHHHRRVFVLEPHDLGAEAPCEAYLSGGAPVESKITSTIAPGVEGVDPCHFPGFAELVAQWKEREG